MKFVETTHKYTDGEIDFTPVTTFLKSFQEKIDWDAIAEKKAKKDGVTKEELLKQWEAKRNKAADKGTAYHKMMEELVQGSGNKVLWTDTVDGVKEDSTLHLEDNTIYTEKMIWNNTYKICGTADLIIVKDGLIHVKDYKTNEKLDKEAYRHPNPKIGKRKLLYPVESLDDCNFNIYQLQLNMYMYMLLQHNRHLKMGNMEILHVQYDKEGNALPPVVEKIDNLQRLIKKMLEHFSLNKTLS